MKQSTVVALAGLSVISTIGWIVTLATRESPARPSPADPAIRPDTQAMPVPTHDGGSFAHVVLPRGQKGINATLRDAPWGAVTAGVAPGTAARIIDRREVAEKRGKTTVLRWWYQIETMAVGAGLVIGWMHGDLLPAGSKPKDR